MDNNYDTIIADQGRIRGEKNLFLFFFFLVPQATTLWEQMFCLICKILMKWFIFIC